MHTRWLVKFKVIVYPEQMVKIEKGMALFFGALKIKIVSLALLGFGGICRANMWMNPFEVKEKHTKMKIISGNSKMNPCNISVGYVQIG